jgi:hypothetical protein
MPTEILTGNTVAELLDELKVWRGAHKDVVITKQYPPAETRGPDGRVVSVSIRIDFEPST